MPADPPFPAISAAVSGLVAASQTGFTISENGARLLLAAMEELRSEIELALRQSSQLEAQPALGSTPNANVYKPFIATIASDPIQGAIPALRKLQDDLIDARSVIKQAMDNYRDSDSVSASKIRQETWV